MFVLQDAEEFGLHGEGHVADFVEEEGSAVGVFEASLAVGAGVGEGAADVSEEFVFEGGFVEAGAVEGDEAFGAAAGVLVEGAGDEFLAGAGVAEDEDVDVGGGDLGDELEDFLDGGGLSDDAVDAEALVEGVGEFGVFAGEEDFFGGAADLGADDFEVEGFLNEVVGAVAHGLDGGVYVAVGGDDDDFGLRLGAADKLEEVEAVVGGIHFEVGDDEVEVVLREETFGIGEVVGLFDGVGGGRIGAAGGDAGDGFGHDVGVIDFIVHDEDADGGGFAHGREYRVGRVRGSSAESALLG